MGPTLLLILALVAGSQAGPIQTEISIGDQCSRQCTVSNQFSYEPGTSYEYQYDNEIRTAVQGASEDHAGIHLTAKIHLDFISKCEAIMRVSDVTLKEHDPETSTMKKTDAALAAVLERNPIRLSFQDGHIEHICLSTEEASEIVNIKRGILSVFQNNMDDISKNQTVSETDVSGNCETEYTSEEKGWYNQQIKKSKNLLGCSGRHGYRSAIQGIPYSSQSKVQSLPLLKSTHDCEQEVVKASGRLVSAVCQEKHTFAPFSRQGSGATTHNTQKLTFVKETKTRSRPVPVSTRASLQFDHAYNAEARTTREDLERKLMEVCKTTKKGIMPETPSLFTSLVNTMKTMEAPEMAAVYENIKSMAMCSENNKMVKKFFLDAIPMTGTTSGLKMMTSLITSQEVSGVEADMWLTTLAFIQHPTVDMLSEVKPLLSMTNNAEKAMLAVSSLVNSICKGTPNCDRIPEVKKILNMLVNKVGACKVTDKNFETTLIALRAIANTRSAASALSTESSISKCMKVSSNPIEIRLSAIEALGLTSCNADRKQLMNVYTDTKEDSEIRIAAYKAMMKCPTTDILRKVKVALGKEEVNQVGSYVWSHLTNLMKTSDPHKQTIRSILEDSLLQKEFDMDKRKFSRNYEGSMFFEKINAGAAVEADLIWSSKSFIPRSAMANITVDLFGNAVNLFEIGGRIEGLEYFLEAYFGPNGHFSENDVQAAADETTLQLVKADKVNRINKRMGSAMEDLRGSLYMKVFGNELRYMNFQGLESSMAKNSINFLDILMKLKDGNDYQFTQSAMFLDSSIIVPTSSGFPLNLTLNGTATVDFKASGKMDVLKLASSPPSLDVRGEIRPSGAVVVSSVMSVDAFVTKVGIKMVSSLYSNTVLKGKISLTDGSIFSMELDAPEEKMDVFNVKSAFFTVHRNLEREQKMITENRQEMRACTGDKLAKITGFELCGEVQFPNASLVENAPYFPMTGPVNIGITLNKRDSLTSYKLEARNTHTRKENVVHAAFSTPNGKIDRSFGINFDLNKAANTFDTSFTSPWTNADFKGAVTKSRNEMGVSGKLNVDNSVRYEVKALVQSTKSGPGMMYTPKLIVHGPNMEPVHLTGAIKYAPWKLLDIDTTVEGITNSPITLKSTVLNKLKVMKLSASIASGKTSPYSVNAVIQKNLMKTKVSYKPQISIRIPTAEVFAFGGNVAYATGKNIVIQGVLDKVFKKPVSTKIVLKKTAFRRGRVMYNTRLDFRSPMADIKIRTKLDNRNMKSLGTDVDLTYVIRRYARDNIKFVSKVTNLSTKALLKGKANMLMTSKKRPEMNFKLTGEVNHNKKHSEIDSAVTYGADPKNVDKQISLSASLDRAIKSWSYASAAFKGEFLMGKNIRMVSKMNHAHTKKSLDSSMMLRLNKNAVSSSLTLKDQSKGLMNVVGEFELSYPGRSVSVGQVIVENKANDYTSTMNAQIGKAKHKIITSWKRESPASLEISSDISLSGSDLLHGEGMYDFSGDTYKTSGAISKGKSTYRFSSTSKVNVGQHIEISSEVECPSRRIVANVEGTKIGSRYSGRSDLQWNAGRDDTERITLLGNGQLLGTDNIDGTLTLQYPTRTISANLKHVSKSKTNSHLDFKWADDKQIFIDTSFGNYEKKGNNVVFGNMKLGTPFKNLKSLNISVENQMEDSEFNTKINVEWIPRNIISAIATIKRPLTLRSIRAEVVAKTPFKSFKNIKASLRHNARQGVKTVGKVGWNKQSAQFDLTLVNNNGGRRTDMRGQLDIKSSFKALKVASIDLSHSGNGNEFQSTASFRHNKNKYSVQNSIRHAVNGWNVNNNGETTITTPSKTIVTKWDHSNTLSEVTSSIDTTWAKNKRVYIKYSGRQDLAWQTGSLSSALEIQTPFKQIRDVVFQVNHEHRPTQIDSSLKITNEGTHLAFVEGKYLIEDKKVTSSFRINDIVVDTEVAYKQYPFTGHLEATFAPQKTTVIDATYAKDNAGNIDGTVKFVMPDVDPVTFTLQRSKQGKGFNSVAQLQYNNDKIVSLESTYRMDRTKVIKLKFMSPFTQDYTADASVQGTADYFEARASIEAEPLLPRWSGSANFDLRNEVSGVFRINTPFRNVSFCQISFGSSVLDEVRKSSLIIEYAPGKKIDISGEYKMMDTKDILMSMMVKTPCTQMPYSEFAFTHRGDMKESVSHAEVEYAIGKKLSLDTTFSMNNGPQGTLSIGTPFSKDFKGSFSHDGDLTNFQTHGDITFGKKHTFDIKHQGTLQQFQNRLSYSHDNAEYRGMARFTLNPTMETELTIETPIKGWETVSLSHSLSGNLWAFSNQAELQVSKYGKFAADMNIDLTNTKSVAITVNTPYKKYSNMRAALSHDGGMRRFQTHAELQNGQEKIVTDIKLNTETPVNFEVSLKTPFSSCRSSRFAVTFDGKANDFTVHTEAQINKAIHEVDLIYDYKKKLNIDVTVKSPLTSTIKASLDHYGSWKKFNSKLRIKSGKTKASSDIRFQIKPSFHASVSIKTPFKMLKNQQFNVKHAGSMNNFKCNMKYRCNNKMYVGDMAFQNANAMRVELNLKAPEFRPINALIQHEGGLSNFKSSADMSMGKKKIQASANLNTDNGVKGTVLFSSPIKGLESMKASLSHSGPINNFRCHGEAFLNKKSGQVDIEFDSSNGLSSSVTLATPFRGYETMTASFKHTGSAKKFTSQGQFVHNGKEIEGQIQFENGNIVSGSATLRSQYKVIQNVEISFTHYGSMEKFNTRGEINVDRQRSQANIMFDSTNGYEGSFNLNSPMVRRIEGSFRHSTGDKIWNTNTRVMLGPDEYQLESDISGKTSLSANIKIQTPFRGFESTEARAHVDGSMQNFISNADLIFKGNKHSLQLDAATTPEVQIKLLAVSPFIDDVVVNVEFTGPLSKFNSAFECTYGKTNLLNTLLSLQTNGPINGDFKMTSSLMKNIEVSFSHSVEVRDFSTKALFVYANKTVVGSASVKLTKDIQVALELRSPFTRDIEVTFEHNGPLENCQTSGNVVYGGESQVRLSSILKMKPSIDGELTVRTSVPGYSQFVLKGSHSGVLSDFNSHGEASLEDQAISGDIVYSPRRGSISLRIPMIDDVDAHYTIEGALPSMEGEVQVSYGSSKLLEATTNIHYPDNAEFVLKVPIPGYEQTRLMITNDFTDGYASQAELMLNGATHQGTVTMNNNNAKVSLKSPMIMPTTVRVTYGKRSGAYQYTGEVTYGDDTHTVETEFGMRRKIHGSILVRSPLMSDLSASFETNKDIENFETHTKLTYGRKTLLNTNISVDTIRQKSASVSIEIPNNIAKASVSLKGQLLSFKGHGEAFFNRQLGEIDVLFDMTNALEGKITLKTPENSLSGFFTVEGEMTDFKGHFESSLNNKNMDGDVWFSLTSDINGLIKLSYPSDSVELSFSHTGSLRNFESNGKLIFRNQESSVGVLLNIDTATKSKVSISTPLSKPFIASLDHIGSMQNFRTISSMQYGQENRVKSEVTFSVTPLRGNLDIETTIPEYETLSAAFNHQGNVLAFSNHAEFTFGGDKTKADMMFNADSLEGMMSASSPYFPLASADFDFKGNLDNFKSQAKFMFNENQYSIDSSLNTRSGIDGSITIKTPIQGYKTIVGTLLHTGVYPNLNSLAEIKTGRRNLAVASAKISTTDGIVGKMFLQSILTPTLQFNINHKGDVTAFTSNAEIRFNGQSTSVNANFKQSPSLEGRVLLSSPYFRPLSGNFKTTGELNEFTAKLMGTVGEDTISGDVTYYRNNDASVTVKIQTPFKGYENMAGSAKYAKSNKEFTSSIEFNLAPEQVYEISTESRWSRGMQGSLSMKTPFTNFRQSSITATYNGVFPNFESGVSVALAGKTYTMNTELAHSRTTSGKLTIETPLKGFENVALNINTQGGITNFQSDAQLQYATGKEIAVSVKNTMSMGKLETKAKFECPEIEDLIFDLSFNGSPVDFTNSLAMSMGSENAFTSSTTFKLDHLSGEFESTLTTTLAGYTDEQKIMLKYNCPNSDLIISAYGKILGNEYSFDSIVKTASAIEGQFSLKTPINQMRDIAFSFEHKGNLRQFTTKSELQYDTNKKISGEVQYAKYGSRRLQTLFELRTPFRDYENTKLSYRHTASVDSFTCETDMSVMGNDFTGNLRASNSPITAKLSITTPFTNYEQIGADMQLTYGSKSYASELNIAYMDGKTISVSSELDIASSPKVAQLKISTPFVGYENVEVRLSHNGDLMNFQSVSTVSSSFIPSLRAQANMRGSSWKNMDAEFVFSSQIRNMEALKFALKNTAARGKYTNHVEASWAPSKSIVFDSTIGKYRDTLTTEITFTSPFDMAREVIVKSMGRKTDTRYFETFSTTYNGKKYVDVDLTVDNDLKKMASLQIKSPKDMSFEIGGLATNGKYEGNIVLNKAVSIDGSFDTRMKKTALKYKCPERSIAVKTTLNTVNPKAEVIIDNSRYAIDMSRSGNGARTKVDLPSRSIVLDGSMNGEDCDGSLMWDADRDETKKIGFRTKLTPARESTKAELTLMMPSIGKDVQIDSEMILNRDRVLFEGKGELTYSKDMRKKFILTSRLEDISRSWNSKNYSFSLGISHPYTSVGVQLSSHLAHSDDKLTGGFDLKYQTVKRDTKTFSVNGEINKMMKSVNFDMNTPIKKISIAGNAQMVSPYSVSVMNKYDGRRPLTTMFSVDPTKRSINFQMNYDQENPNSEFHIVAKYDNSSAVSAEVFHVVNRRRVTDALASLRLNNSHLLHSRVHWRPAMLNDLKEYTEKKPNSYSAKLKSAMSEVSRDISNEAEQKVRLIRESLMEEMRPLMEVMLEQTERFIEMYETNKYHVKDITDATVATAEDAVIAYHKMATASNKYLQKMSKQLKERASNCIEECRKDVDIVLAKVNEVTLQLTERQNQIYNSYSERLYNMTRHPTIVSLQRQYNDYVTRINAIPVQKHLSGMADKYTDVIYAAHDVINTRMNSLMSRNDVRYVKAVSDKVVQQGKNAYIYWEIRENAEVVAKAIVDWIKSEIEKEISDLKATTIHIMKTSVTVYDPEHGEIQVDIHLPFPLRSLDKVPVVQVAPYINKAKRYIPKVPTMSFPSSDIRTWIPPFDTVATIEGDKVTTFDGLTYNLDGQCTFLLTKDFVDGNFSIGLNNGENRSLTISADGKNIIILADGQVLVDNKLTSLPAVFKNITISAYNNVVTVKGAGNFVVAYNKEMNVYAIKLNGWYFGKVSGLLGTYDNEPSNEMMTSFGNVKNDAGRFSKSWDIGTARCR